jgi:peptide deformylase
MDVRQYPDPVLRAKTAEVTQFDQALADLAKQMITTMHAANGLGLAAPQVGVSRRIAIVAGDGEPGHETVLVNPQIVESEGWEEAEEGCLSFPGIYIKMGRFARVFVRYHDLKGGVCEMGARGLAARAVQHEVDHLDGRLLVDRMSTVQRMAHRRRLRELEERYRRPDQSLSAR